jgi:uracil-DNA glycosylase
MTEDQLEAWAASKKAISACRECTKLWPSRIELPLLAAEVPDPRRSINVLFVGVAPPPITKDGDNLGHFYSNRDDRLRRGLFQVLDRLFGSDLTARNKADLSAGTIAFLDAGFFLVHSAKVAPVRGKLAPDQGIIRFCAKQHLAKEICMLRPKAVCFLGATNAAPAATAVFQHRVGETPEHLEIRGEPEGGFWRGWVAVTVQPVRGTIQAGSNRERVAKVIDRLRYLIMDVK